MVAARAQRGYFGPRPRRYQQNMVIGPRHDWISRAFATGAFTLLLVLNIALLSLKVGGVPVRGIASVGLLMLLAILYPKEARTAFERHLLLFGLAAALALEGAFVSLVNGTSMGDIAQAVTEVQLQAAVTLMVAAILVQICGVRACVFALLLVIGVSALVAVLQAAHFDFAWAMRKALGPLSHDELNPSKPDRRPTGLSYSPIQLSTHVCLAFGVFTAVRDRVRQPSGGKKAADGMVIVALLVFVATCIASGTRAPILGAFIFLGLYVALRRGSSFVLLLTVAGVIAVLAWPLIMSVVQSSAPRVVRVDDNSAAARLVFDYFGIRLFLDNPLGYGMAFDPSHMWMRYWPDLYTMQGAQGAQEHDLHNYVFNMLNIYGIGLLLFVPITAKLLRSAGPILLFFVPYIVHILFHNYGPFYNDTIIWFVIATVAATAPMKAPARAYRRAGPSHSRFGRRALVPLPARYAPRPGIISS